MTSKEARTLAKGERVRITAKSPALAGRECRVLDARSLDVPTIVKFGRNGYRIGRPPFVVCVGGARDRGDDFTAAVAAEFVERA